MFIVIPLMLSLNILMTKCDQTCDCQEIGLLKEIIQKEMLQRKLETSRLLAKMRRIEATQRLIPISAEAGVGIADRLEQIDIKCAGVDVKLNDLLEVKSELEGNRNLAAIVKKGLVSEKQERVEFVSDMKFKMAEIKETVANFMTDTRNFGEQSNANTAASLYKFRHEVNATLHEMEEQTHLKIKSVKLQQDLLESEVSKLNDMVMSRKNVNKVAFTATYRAAGDGNGVITFSRVVENHGDSYNSTTGKFACKIPGIYHFVASLRIRTRQINKLLSCSIFVNDIYKQQLFMIRKLIRDIPVPPTAAGTFHLNKGDSVYLMCDDNERFNGDFSSILTGFLVSTDN